MDLKLWLAAALSTGACFAQSHIDLKGQSGQFQAKIALEDGSPPAHDPLVTVRPNMTAGCNIRQIFGNGTVMYSAWSFDGAATTDQCAVTIRLDGFHTTQATLRDGAVIALKRLSDTDGVIIPPSSATAPKPAAKAYAKGADALHKGKWAEAQQSLEKAVELYPEYAQAFSDMGEALEKQQKVAEARTAYEKALALSPRYLKPYAQLARVAISQNKNDEALEMTDRAIKLGALEFPAIYYYRALACRQLRRLPQAEESATQAIELDADHQLPRAPFLLGVILEEKGDRAGAVKAYEQYVKQTPAPGDAHEVTARIERLKAGT